MSVNGGLLQRHSGSSLVVNSSSYTAPEVFQARQKRWMEYCNSHSTLSGKVHGVFTHSSGVLYCFVPKAGCTFWKQVFNYANNNGLDKKKYTSPWEYPRLLVHNNAMGKGRRFIYPADEKKYQMRVVVSRDPFSRVLSSYLDKFYLPDFWFILGTRFERNPVSSNDQQASKFFITHFEDMNKAFSNTYKIPARKACGNRLTFSQFLSNALGTYEPHWLPVHSICNPCKLKPTHVIHMETFTSDARVVMRQMGMDHFLEGFDPVQQTNTEIDTIVKYNFERIFVAPSKKQYEGCVSREELAYRLWTNFQWRGYIHPDFHYHMPATGIDVKEDLQKQLAAAREAAIRDPTACKKFKEDFKIKAFKSLSKSLFEKLVQYFAVDTELFGYEDVIEKMRALYT